MSLSLTSSCVLDVKLCSSDYPENKTPVTGEFTHRCGKALMKVCFDGSYALMDNIQWRVMGNMVKEHTKLEAGLKLVTYH